MPKIQNIDSTTRATVVALVQRERTMSLSRQEWQHRLAGYGYTITPSAHGEMITTLPHGLEICVVPASC